MRDLFPLTSAESVAQTGRPLSSHRFSAILPMSPAVAQATAEELITLLKKSILESELTAVAEAEAEFHPFGLSAVVILKESHVAAHCWPEINKILVDVHICDYFADNRMKAHQLCARLGMALSGNSDLDLWHYARIAEKPKPEV